MKLYSLLFFLSTCGLFAQGQTARNEQIPSLNKLDTANIKTYQSPNVTVTSTRAEFGKSPVSFSELGQEELELRTGAVDLPKLINYQPSVYTYSDNGNYMGYSYVRLRGFDQRRIAVYINGVPQNDPEIHNVFWLNLNDIQESVGEIQIQRGAGLSNYGAPSIAGSINLTTSNFVNEPGIRLSLGGGFQEFVAEKSDDFLDFSDWNGLKSNASKMKLEYSSGLVDNKYAFYGKLSRINSGGYRDNSWAQMNSWFLGAVRYDENLTTQINIFGGNQVDGLAYTGIPKSDIDNPNLRLANYLSRDEQESFSSPQFQVLNDWRISENLSFNSTLYYFEGKGYFDYPGGPFQSSFFNFSDDVTMGESVIRGYVGNKQGGWIPRLVYRHSNGKGELTTGMEIRMHNSEHWGNFQYATEFPEGFDRDFKIFQFNSGKNIFSFFAREKYNLTEKLTVNIEGQLVNNQYFLGDEEFAGETTSYQTVDGVKSGKDLFTIDYMFFNPRVGANYNLNDKLNFYTSVAYTSREPRRNAIYNADFAFFGSRPLFEATLDTNDAPVYDFDTPLIEPERMLNIELGSNYKSEYVTGGANLYVMNYTDELVATGQIDIYGAPIEGNAPRTSHYGIELFGRHRWDLGGRNLAIDFNFNYSINQIDEMINSVPIDVDGDFVTDTSLTFDLAGNTIAGFPDFILNFGVDYNYGGFTFRLDGKLVSEMRLNNYSIEQQSQINSIYEAVDAAVPVPTNVIDSYFVIDANASYRLDDVLGSDFILFKLQVSNLTNELYALFANESGFFVAAERNYWLGIELGL